LLERFLAWEHFCIAVTETMNCTGQ
jgi:hypothetical protein